MIVFKLLNIADSLLVTLNEKSLLPAPFFLFVFTNITTREAVTFTQTAADDTSKATQRYNEFIINTSVLFAGKTPGQWHYEIYESSTASAGLAGLTMLENGKMLLIGTTQLIITGYAG